MVQPRSKDKVILKTGTTPTKVYLAHPRSERGYGQHLEQRLGLLGLDVMNPFDYVGIIYDDDRIDIVQKDLDAMSLCELVIAFIPLPDNGVMGEIYHASQILNIPVIILTHSHDIWLRFCRPVFSAGLPYLSNSAALAIAPAA